MEPLEITARLWGRLILPPSGYIHLDGLLAWAVAEEECRPPVLNGRPPDIEIPVARSDCGRYHLCSASVSKVRQREVRWINKRFPVEHWQALGGGKSAERIQVTAGPSKGFREPAEAAHLVDDQVRWWCVGERERIAELLELVTHVGRRRAVGEGEVREWSVAQCEPWGPGFPVLAADGRVLRHLPGDAAVTGPHVPRFGCVTYPYWDRSAEEPIVAPVPEWSC